MARIVKDKIISAENRELLCTKCVPDRLSQLILALERRCEVDEVSLGGLNSHHVISTLRPMLGLNLHPPQLPPHSPVIVVFEVLINFLGLCPYGIQLISEENLKEVRDKSILNCPLMQDRP